MAFQMTAWTSIDGSMMAIVSGKENPMSAYVGSTDGSICVVMMAVALQWKAVPRNSSSSSAWDTFVARQRSSFLSDMSSYVSAWCSTWPSPGTFGATGSPLTLEIIALIQSRLSGRLNSRCWK